jgi:hypothetical protein
MAGNVWIRTVEPHHRIRLNREIIAAVRWLDVAKPRTAFAFIGKEGQLEIAPDQPAAEAEILLEQKASLRSGENPFPDDWRKYSRFLASIWPLRFLVEPDRTRLSFVLPREARTLRIVPNAGGVVALYAHGELFEVWDRDTWVAHLRAVRPTIDTLAEDIVEELTDVPRTEVSRSRGRSKTR